jgi:hypothetical protein
VPPDALSSTADILADFWSRLTEATGQVDHPFRTAAFATVAVDGAVTARTVVVRYVQREAAAVTFHTDRRSEKFTALQADPRCAFLFYDAADKLQARLTALATLHTDDPIADDLWVATPPASRGPYASPLAPGTALTELPVAPPPPVGDGRAQFVAVRCTVLAIDWLHLHKAAHRRVKFDLRQGTVASQIVAP